MNRLGYTPLQIERGPQNAATQTAEWKHWAKFKPILQKQQPNAVLALSANHNQKNNIFIAHGRTVEMFSANKAEITKNFTKFKDNVTALCSRNDAKLFAVGFESGLINVVDVKNKLTLRTFDNHKKRVNALEYCNFNDLFSGSDDMIVRQFDVVSGSIVHSYANTHTDYVKSIKCLQSNHILTASYDGKIKLFDFRVHKQAEMVFDHKSPVEAIDKFTNGLSFVACGGTAVSVWDVRNGKQLHYGANNKKTVTSIKVLESGERFLTGSLDQHLKIYSTDLFELTYNEKYSDSIMSIEVTPSQRILAVGLNNGQLHIKGSGSKQQQNDDEEEKQIDQLIPEFMKLNAKPTPTYNNSFFYRGIYQQPDQYDQKVEQIGQRTGFYDRCLKKFEYAKALTTAAQKNQVDIFVSLLLEIQQRGAIERTITTLDEEQLRVLLQLAANRLGNAKFRAPILRLIDRLWEIHGTDRALREDWLKIESAVSTEIQLEQEMLQQVGILECVDLSS